MRLLIAVAMPAVGIFLGNLSGVSAGDAAAVPPLPALARAPLAPVSSFGLVLPEQTESVPTPADVAEPPPTSGAVENGPAAVPSVQAGTPISVRATPPESYQEISERYPAPAQSLVPPALQAGPQFWGAGSRGGAWSGGTHLRYPYFSYRSPWTYGGPASVNHTIHW